MQAPAPAFRKIEGGQDVVFDEEEPEPELVATAARSAAAAADVDRRADACRR